MKLELQAEKMLAHIDDGIGWMTLNNPRWYSCCHRTHVRQYSEQTF